MEHVLRVAKAAYDSMRAHGEEAYPLECCGALLGEFAHGEWRVSAAARAANARTDAAHNRYSIDAAELVQIQREAMGRGLDIAGFYHSHPDYPARWSATDFAEAHWVGCCYVITEVRMGKAGETRAFLLAGTREEDKRFEAMEVRVDESSGGDGK